MFFVWDLVGRRFFLVWDLVGRRFLYLRPEGKEFFCGIWEKEVFCGTCSGIVVFLFETWWEGGFVCLGAGGKEVLLFAAWWEGGFLFETWWEVWFFYLGPGGKEVFFWDLVGRRFFISNLVAMSLFSMFFILIFSNAFICEKGFKLLWRRFYFICKLSFLIIHGCGLFYFELIYLLAKILFICEETFILSLRNVFFFLSFIVLQIKYKFFPLSVHQICFILTLK